MLLLWLLALASGMLHACLPGPEALRASPVAHCPDHAQPAQAADLSACGKFCADAAGSLPSATPSFDAGAAIAMAVLPTLALTLASQAEVSAPAWTAAPLPQPAGPPIPISFLRLTL